MVIRYPRLVIIALLLCLNLVLSASLPAWSQDKAATTVPASNVVENISTFKDKDREYEELLNSHTEELKITSDLEEIAAKIDEHKENNKELLENNTPHDVWVERSKTVESWQKQLKEFADTLTERSKKLLTCDKELQSQLTIWTKAQSSASTTDLGADITASVEDIIKTIGRRREQIRSSQDHILEQQNTIVKLRDALAEIEKTQNDAITRQADQLWTRDAEPLHTEFSTPALATMIDDTIASGTKQWQEFQIFIGKHDYSLGIFLLLFVLFWVGLRHINAISRAAINSSMQEVEKSEQESENAANKSETAEIRLEMLKELRLANKVLEVPISIALILALVCLINSELSSSHLFMAMASLLIVLPAVHMLKLTFDLSDRDAYLAPILNTLLVVYALDQLRGVLYSVPLAARLILLTECLCLAFFSGTYLWQLRNGKIFGSLPDDKRKSILHYAGLLSKAAILAIVITIICAYAGYTTLAIMLIRAILSMAVTAVICSVLIKFILVTVFFTVSIRPLKKFNYLQKRRLQILKTVSILCEWMLICCVIRSGLHSFGLLKTVYDGIAQFLGVHISTGSIDIRIGQILLALIILALTYWLSKVAKGICQEDIVPRLSLKDNTTNLLLVAIRCSIAVVGILTACGVLGLAMTNLTVVAGALSVGIGFGLQNIINNFVSGLILLFDPRIMVGGTVEFGTFTGELIEVGLRASIVRLHDGRDLIVPNSELMTQKIIYCQPNAPDAWCFYINFTLECQDEAIAIKKIVETRCYNTLRDIQNEWKDTRYELDAKHCPSLRITGLAGGNPQFTLCVWSLSDDFRKVPELQSRIMYELLHCFKEQKWTLVGGTMTFNKP